MSTKVRFHYFNLVSQSATTITASSEDPFYPASNLKLPQVTKVWRTSSGNASGNILLDFKTVESVNTILYKPSLDGFGFNGSLTVAANSTGNFTSPAYSTTFTPDSEYSLGIKYLSSAQSYRYWKVTGSGTSYLELSKIFIGSYYEPGKNASLNWSFEDLDLSKISKNRYGQRFIDRTNDQKKIKFSIDWLTSSETDDFLDFIDTVGTYSPFWIVMDNDEAFSPSKYLFAGKYYFEKKPVLTNQEFGYYNTSLRMIECI